MVKHCFISFILLFAYSTKLMSICIKELFNETLEPIPVVRHVVNAPKYDISFNLPRDFSKLKSRYIVSENIPSDTYIGSLCIFENKINNESYFVVSESDYINYAKGSIMNEEIGNLMPLFCARSEFYWYNCGFLDNKPFVLMSNVVPFRPFGSYMYKKDLIKIYVELRLYVEDETVFSFEFISISSRYNFRYDKILDIFKSIEIKEIGEQKEK